MPTPKDPHGPAAGMALVQNLVGLALAFFLEKGGFSYAKPSDLKNAAVAFCVYLMIVYLLMFRQGMTKFVNMLILEHPEQKAHVDVVAFMSNVNRSFENAIEQMPLFLTAFFFYTALVNPVRAAAIGFLYAFLTALYPCLYQQDGLTHFASTFPRYFMNHYMIWAVLLAAFRTHGATLAPTPSPTPRPTSRPTPRPTPYPPSPTAPPTHAGYRAGQGHVYSNNKYLADFDHGMELSTCKHRCNNWMDVCPELCEQKHACLLSDDVDVRHFTRHVSCKKECMGFNWHPDTGHCTLFSDNLKLLHGGRGIYYGRPDFPPPKWGSLTPTASRLYEEGWGVIAENSTPYVVGGFAVVSLVFLAIRWARRPANPSFTEVPILQVDAEVPFASEE